MTVDDDVSGADPGAVVPDGVDTAVEVVSLFAFASDDVGAVVDRVSVDAADTWTCHEEKQALRLRRNQAYIQAVM